MRGFESNKGTIKQPKNMNGKICLQPFTNIDIHSDYGTRTCSESWMPSWNGDFSKNSIMEIWNNEITQKIRKSILDGTYEFCDWHQCPFYSNDSYYLYTMDQLDDEKLAHYRPWIEYIKKGETKLDIYPANYNLAYDETCNLQCPSCRNYSKVYTTGNEFEKRLRIQKKLLDELMKNGLESVGRFNLSGSGEPFSSRVFKDFLFNFDGNNYPNLRINIQSNGLLFNEAAWDKMDKIQSNINEVIISLDASKAETYEKIRVNGSYKTLRQNIDFLSQLRRENKIKRLMLAFVVQKLNYREMTEAITIAKNYNADLIIFNLLNDWLCWSKEEYEANAVWKQYHPEYQEFLNVLQDPIFDDPINELGNMIDYRKLAIKQIQV